MKLRYSQFRNWCFGFMGEEGNEGYTSDSLVSQYLAYKKSSGKTIRGVPSIASASEVLKRDSRFKKGEKMEKSWKNDLVWVSPRTVWFLNPNNE